VALTDELVKQAGVSRSTVFRFLRGENVRPAARQSILAAMKRLNMEPADYAVHEGRTILVSVGPGFESFKGYDLAITGFVERGESQGFRFELKSGSPAVPRTDQGANDDLVGVVFLGRTIPEEEAESARLRQRGIPHVFVNRIFDDPGISWVSVDHRGAARDAVFFLMDQGYTEIGTWGHTSLFRVDREKRRGYVTAHEERGVAVPDSCLSFDEHGDLEPAVQRLVAEKRLPPAWFAASDEHALRLIKVVREYGVNVPDDIVIVGMDDAGQAEFMNPSLTTIHIPFRSAGAAAFEVLRHLIENPEEESMRVVMKHRLVVRESCGADAKQKREEKEG
jgi:DNA-binding LacI/PurR family transcriptional regulator